MQAVFFKKFGTLSEPLSSLLVQILVLRARMGFLRIMLHGKMERTHRFEGREF